MLTSAYECTCGAALYRFCFLRLNDDLEAIGGVETATVCRFCAPARFEKLEALAHYFPAPDSQIDTLRNAFRDLRITPYVAPDYPSKPAKKLKTSVVFVLSVVVLIAIKTIFEFCFQR